MRPLPITIFAFALACCTAACVSSSPTDSPAVAPPMVELHIKAATGSVEQWEEYSNVSWLGPKAVCGTWVLQPYSLDAAGHATFQGAPLEFASEPGPGFQFGVLDVTMACAEPPHAVGHLGLLITALDLGLCGMERTEGPQSAPVSLLRTFSFDCRAGQRTSLDIAIEVSLPSEVTSEPGSVGCKDADLGEDSNVYFGASGLYASGDEPLGLTAFSHLPQALERFAGSSSWNGVQEVYYTGRFPPEGAGNTILQTFGARCDASGGQYADAASLACVTRIHSLDGGSRPGLATERALGTLLGSPQGVVWANSLDTNHLRIFTAASSDPQVSQATAGAPAHLQVAGLRESVYQAPAGVRLAGTFADRAHRGGLLATGLDTDRRLVVAAAPAAQVRAARVRRSTTGARTGFVSPYP